MFRLSFPKSEFIPPANPNVRIEMALGCDGEECGYAIHDEDGQLEDPPPHFHLIESEMGAGTRKYVVG
jgi:hypothetical protein